MKTVALALTFALSWSGLALAQDAAPTDKIEGYKEASPADKLVLIAVASTDKVLNHKETSAAVAEVATAEVDKGKDPKERLELLGKLRGEAQAKLKEVNKTRKAAKKSFASFREPESYFQQAIALQYIAFATGPKPTLEQLGCLKLVRDNTNWSAHHPLVLATASEAFSRDEEFMKADMPGKLSVIKKQAEDRGLLSDHERSYIEKSVISEWLNAQLSGGASVEEISATLKDLKGRKQLCFFTSSWADGILKRLATFPPLKKEAGSETPPAEAGK